MRNVNDLVDMYILREKKIHVYFIDYMAIWKSCLVFGLFVTKCLKKLLFFKGKSVGKDKFKEIQRCVYCLKNRKGVFHGISKVYFNIVREKKRLWTKWFIYLALWFHQNSPVILYFWWPVGLKPVVCYHSNSDSIFVRVDTNINIQLVIYEFLFSSTLIM